MYGSNVFAHWTRHCSKLEGARSCNHKIAGSSHVSDQKEIFVSHCENHLFK